MNFTGAYNYQEPDLSNSSPIINLQPRISITLDENELCNTVDYQQTVDSGLGSGNSSEFASSSASNNVLNCGDGNSRLGGQKEQYDKRPPNAYNLFCKINKCDKLNFIELRKFQALWKNLSDEEKRPYFKEAKRLAVLHKQMCPNPNYKPARKRSKNNANKPPSTLIRQEPPPFSALTQTSQSQFCTNQPPPMPLTSQFPTVWPIAQNPQMFLSNSNYFQNSQQPFDMVFNHSTAQNYPHPFLASQIANYNYTQQQQELLSSINPSLQFPTIAAHQNTQIFPQNFYNGFFNSQQQFLIAQQSNNAHTGQFPHCFPPSNQQMPLNYDPTISSLQRAQYLQHCNTAGNNAGPSTSSMSYVGQNCFPHLSEQFRFNNNLPSMPLGCSSETPSSSGLSAESSSSMVPVPSIPLMRSPSIHSLVGDRDDLGDESIFRRMRTVTEDRRRSRTGIVETSTSKQRNPIDDFYPPIPANADEKAQETSSPDIVQSNSNLQDMVQSILDIKDLVNVHFEPTTSSKSNNVETNPPIPRADGSVELMQQEESNTRPVDQLIENNKAILLQQPSTSNCDDPAARVESSLDQNGKELFTKMHEELSQCMMEGDKPFLSVAESPSFFEFLESYTKLAIKLGKEKQPHSSRELLRTILDSKSAEENSPQLQQANSFTETVSDSSTSPNHQEDLPDERPDEALHSDSQDLTSVQKVQKKKGDRTIKDSAIWQMGIFRMSSKARAQCRECKTTYSVLKSNASLIRHLNNEHQDLRSKYTKLIQSQRREKNKNH